MGLNFNDVKYLLWAKEKGVNFTKVMTLGRQKLYLNVSSMQAVLSSFGIEKSRTELAPIFSERQGYAEPFFKFLGALEIDSVDASSYENASHVLDMNQPVGSDLKEKFSVVFDGGSLEHVFNFPVAIRNCMEMVKSGGHFIGVTPCNNYLGHGFYQFSPELFYRIFTEQNGFKIEKMILYETSPMARWYQVRDPEELGKRAEVRTRRNTLLVVQARRIAIKPLFVTTPQQSDYAAVWDAPNANGQTSGSTRNMLKPSLLMRIKMSMPAALKTVFWNLKESMRPKINSEGLEEVRIPETR